MPELALVELIAPLGVGGVLGIIIFLMYRRDRRDTETRWADMVEDLIDSRNRETTSRDKNTRATTRLSTYIKKLNGKK